MSLTYKDQAALLKDIMLNHLEDCCGSVSEYEQLGRLVQSLLLNQQIDSRLHPVLNEIYAYCQASENTQDLEGHITAHQSQLSEWVGHIDTFV